MVEDSRAAALSVPGVRRAEIMLDGHHASGEINSGVEDGRGFDDSFAGETSGEALDEVRNTFRRKAFVRRQEMLCRAFDVRQREPARPRRHDARRRSRLRRSSVRSIWNGGRSWASALSPGSAARRRSGREVQIPEAAVVDHLRFARLTRVSIEGNAAHCLGLLAARYDTDEDVKYPRKRRQACESRPVVRVRRGHRHRNR